MILLTGFYFEPEARRRGEFLECLRRNHENKSFEGIHLWVQAPVDLEELVVANPFLADRSVRLIAHNNRLTYKLLFAYANEQLPGWKVVIANADIFFDETLKSLDPYRIEGQLLCLSRWDVHADGDLRLFDHSASQDAWVFRAPIREFFSDFHMGVPGCDNRLAWEARQAGLELLNPAKSVRACHLHLSGVRRYGERDRVPGPSWPVAPGFLGPAACNNSLVQASANRNAMAPGGRCIKELELEADAMSTDPVFAVTSLSPALSRVPVQKACIESWRRAGLRVFSFNHPSEIATLRPRYDVEWVPVEKTAKDLFGVHYVPIRAVMEWAAERDEMVLLINSDIELRLEQWQLKRIRWLTHGGLSFFIRHNHSGDIAKATIEPHGIEWLSFSRKGCAPGARFLS